jgi:hypothetical protein
MASKKSNSGPGAKAPGEGNRVFDDSLAAPPRGDFEYIAEELPIRRARSEEPSYTDSISEVMHATAPVNESGVHAVPLPRTTDDETYAARFPNAAYNSGIMPELPDGLVSNGEPCRSLGPQTKIANASVQPIHSWQK